jgi:GTP-binding protein
MSRHGKSGEDCLIYVPVGATVTDTHRGRTYVFTAVDQTERVLRGGRGGLGNEHFKSATHRSPEESTKGKKGEVATLHIVLSLVADVGIIGFPNAGKSTLLNALTGAHSRVGAYPFTTTEPHLGNFNGYILADIPGLIHGASKGKGLGHTFLRHIERTGILLHCISLEHDDVSVAYETIRDELREFNQALAKKREIIVLTKTDLVQDAVVARWRTYFKSRAITAYDVSVEQRRGLNTLSRGLSQALHDLNNT